MLIRQRPVLGAIALIAACLVATPALAENIAVGNYGSSANGMPFAVALYKGFFKEEGADVTGIIASQGGGTSVRNAMAGVAYGEANPGAIAVAIQQGADIRIVSDNVLTIAEFAWMVKKDSPVKTIKDLKGRKIGYTNPRSTSQALAVLLTIPLFFPIVSQLGFDPIWFGVLIVMIVQIGLISPPVGMNLFVINALLPAVGLGNIFRGCWPFVLVMVLVLGVLIAFPQLSLWLPSLMK